MAPAYLSFNPHVEGHFTQTDTPKVDVDLSKDPSLRNRWVLWEQITSDNSKGQNYSDATHKVASISTVKEFWKYWNHLPQPSELLQNKKFVREGEDQNGKPTESMIDAIMIFKEGIKPEWEDKLNSTGGHFPFTLKTSLGGGTVDEYWNNLVLGMIGSTIEPAEMITGIRLVDKLGARAPCIRIEVWFTKYADTENVDLLQKSVESCMLAKLDGTQSVCTWGKVERKKHS